MGLSPEVSTVGRSQQVGGFRKTCLLILFSVSLCLCGAWQTLAHQTFALPIAPQIAAFPFKVPDPYLLLLSSEGHINLNWLTSWGLLFLWSTRMYTIKSDYLIFLLSIFLLSICFFDQPGEPRRVEEVFFSLIVSSFSLIFILYFVLFCHICDTWSQ